MDDPMRLLVFGSRSLCDERVKILILEAIEKHNASCLVTAAEPGGVCRVARNVAKELAIPLHLHFLNFRYGRGAFARRSQAAFRDCDFALLIHDGISQGTANEKLLADKLKIPYPYEVMGRSEYDASVGFDIDISWDQAKLSDGV